jgi:hypothetical protein
MPVVPVERYGINSKSFSRAPLNDQQQEHVQRERQKATRETQLLAFIKFFLEVSVNEIQSKPNQTKPNQTKPKSKLKLKCLSTKSKLNQTEPNQIKSKSKLKLKRRMGRGAPNRRKEEKKKRRKEEKKKRRKDPTQVVVAGILTELNERGNKLRVGGGGGLKEGNRGKSDLGGRL